MTSPPRLFLSRAGRQGEDESDALESGLAIVGFRKVGSLEEATTREEIKASVKESFPEKSPNAIGNFAGQLNNFVLRMREGDLVVLPKKRSSQVAIGVVDGPYAYREVDGEPRHTRSVKWLKTDVSRTVFEQDLLFSFGAFMTVCEIDRNNAVSRVQAILKTGRDPGGSVRVTIPTKSGTPRPASSGTASSPSLDGEGEIEAEVPDLSQLAHDQIVAHIQSKFAGHRLADLVDAVLQADDWVTKTSPPGRDGGVDVLAGRGPLGLDAPRLCVQVKSQTSTADVTVFRGLQGTMQTFNAEQGLLVCWGGFNSAVMSEANKSHFTVRLWDSRDLVEAVYRTYNDLPAEIQADLPLKRSWVLVLDADDD